LASFHAAYPRSDVATAQLITRLGQSAEVVVKHQSGKEVSRLIITFLLPLMILANLFGIIFVLASSGGDSGLSEVAGFGRFARKGKRKKAAQEEVTFADVAGVGNVVTELQEVIDYLQDPGKFEAFAAVAPKGVLLFGPPGCGKTLLARAVAGESGVPFVTASGTEFVESLVGVGAARGRDLFSQVRELAPAILFIDEIDAVGRKREGEGVSGGEREQTLNQLLVEMDGFEVSSGVVLMGATNRPDILDAALLRQGRFDRHITLEAPDADGRAEILAVHSRSRPVSPEVDLSLIAKRTPGFTGADLASVINEAALLAVREGEQGGQISPRHVSEAVERVLHGPHRGKLMSPQERHRLAVHESGHAVVAAALGRGSELHRVSILAQAAGLAKTSITGDGDRILLTDADIEHRLTMA
ncbi:MAG: AAA family ATPase, partial [Actinobacteria bacterium]|nr:AAA family ATPase [Actinomycetota bacterium]